MKQQQNLIALPSKGSFEFTWMCGPEEVYGAFWLRYKEDYDRLLQALKILQDLAPSRPEKPAETVEASDDHQG